MRFIKKDYQTKNDHLLYKFNVLKFGVDSFIDIKGRPLFVRVTLFWFFYYIFRSNDNFEVPKIGFERSPQYVSDCIHLFFKFLFINTKNGNLGKKWRFSSIFFTI